MWRLYFAELDRKPNAYDPLLDTAYASDVTFLFGAKDEQNNNAVALREFLAPKLHRK